MFATYKRIAHANRIPGTGTAKVVNPNPNLPRLFICSALHGLSSNVWSDLCRPPTNEGILTAARNISVS